MNIGLTTSFIVAGILLLSILSMNRNISQSSTELTIRQITQRRANTVGQILQKDIPNIGVDINAKVSSPIKVAKENIIEFEGNIDYSGGVETIRWEYTSTGVASTQNPNDNTLTRTVDGVATEFKSGITNVEFIYRDESLNIIPTPIGTQSDRDNIRYIEVSVTVQSAEPVRDKDLSNPYIETILKKKFSPINLRL